MSIVSDSALQNLLDGVAAVARDRDQLQKLQAQRQALVDQITALMPQIADLQSALQKDTAQLKVLFPNAIQ